MATGTRDDLIAATIAPPPFKSVYVSHLKKYFWVKGLKVEQRSKWEASFQKGRGMKQRTDTTKARESLLALAVIRGAEDPEEQDPARIDFTPLFTAADHALLAQLPAYIAEPLYDAAREISKIGEQDVEELEKLSAEGASSAQASS